MFLLVLVRYQFLFYINMYVELQMINLCEIHSPPPPFFFLLQIYFSITVAVSLLETEHVYCACEVSHM